MKQARISIAASPASDHGRSIVRIPSELMGALNIVPGDAVSVTHKQQTHCRAMRGQLGSEQIEIDPETAARIGGVWGEMVNIKRSPLAPLKSMIVTLSEGKIASNLEIGEALFDLPFTTGDSVEVSLSGGRKIQMTVAETEPAPAGFFGEGTVLSVASTSTQGVQYSGIGGLEDQIARVHEMVTIPLQNPELFERLGISPPQGILFTGPPGSGKTLLARAVAARTDASFFHVNGPEIVSKHYGESEAALRKVFAAAGSAAPAIIFIDELDAIAPRRDSLSGEKQVERRVVAQLLTLMDGLADRGQIVVMAASNLPDSIEPALRRPGRFDREIVFRPPNDNQRRDILEVLLVDAPLSKDVDLGKIAQQAQGYLGADLASLSRESAIAALVRSAEAAGGEGNVRLEDLHITSSDLEHGLAATRPAVLRDTVVENPAVSWDDIGGYEEVKSALREAVLYPLAHRDSYQSLGVPAAKGILLSGPPGSGKTLLAQAMATESGLNFIGVRPSKVLSQFLGEAERAVADLFSKARQSAPTLIFFDEIDALASKRGTHDAVHDRIVAQLLVEMDGLTPNDDVIVLAATNRAASLDPALLRAGRIDLVIPVSLPRLEERRSILNVHLRNRSCGEVNIESLVQETDGASGAELAGLVQSAARHALRRHLSDPQIQAELTQADFTKTLAERSARKTEEHTDYTCTEESSADEA